MAFGLRPKVERGAGHAEELNEGLAGWENR